jgi:putative sterol carrier protein
MSSATGWQADVIARLHDAFRADAAAGERVAYQIVLTGPRPGAIWLDVRDGRLAAGEGRMPAADVTFELGHEDLIAVLGGTSNPDLLFMEERIRVDGELSLALKLRKLFRAPA